MHTDSLDKTRRLVIRKVGFLVVLMFVALAYAAAPLTAFACNGDNNSSSSNGNGNKNGGGVAARDKQARADLNGGSTIASLTINGNSVQLTDIKPPDKFQITFADGVKLDAVCIVAGNTPDPEADVTLPSGKEVLFRPKAPQGQIVTDIVNPKSLANSSKKETFSLFLNSSPSDWQLFNLNGSPLDLSAIKRAGQQFNIEKIGSGIVMLAFYKGHNSVLVTVPPTKQLMSIPLSEL